MHKLFSVDDHIIEPEDVWSSRVPTEYRETAPHVIEADGRQYWAYEDTRAVTMGLNAVAGLPREQWTREPVRFEDMIPSCYDPVLRAREFRAQGILASVNFPTLPRFGGALFNTFRDKTLADVCVRAWNDFLIEEWCGASPEMFVPMVICQLWDPDLAALEIRRCLDKGAKALCFVENPVGLGLPSFHTEHWDPIFRLCEEADLPICMHIGSSGEPAGVTDHETTPSIVRFASTSFAGAALSTINMMLSPLPRRFPGIKLVWSEGGIGWVPSAVERADRQYERHIWSHAAFQDDLLPSDICRRNMWFCMVEEPFGIKYRHDVGVSRILWESDFPHADTPYPEVQASASALFAPLPDDERAMIAHANAEALFDFRLVESADGSDHLASLS